MIGENIPVLIPVTFLAFSLLIMFIGLWRRRLSYSLAVIGAGISTVLSIYGLYHLLGDSGTIRYALGGWEPPVGIEFYYDRLAAFVLLVINSVAFLVLLHSRQVGKKEFPGKRMGFYAVSMLLMLGFNGMVLTGDLFNLYVFLEISSLASYGLIAVGDRQASVSALRYLIIGTIGGSMFLLGTGFLYTVTGTLNIVDMAAMLPELIGNDAVRTGLVLITLGIGVKAALFPLHGWLPDAYTYASSSSSALIAPIGTKVAAYVLFRVLLFLFGLELIRQTLPLTTILSVLAAGGILYGSVMAIAQDELKKMLAYSSVSQIGYIFLGLSLTNVFGLIGAVLHILNHAMMKSCLFLVSGNLRSQGIQTKISKFNTSYSSKYPWSMAAFTTAALSMVGLPPLAGFFSKWYLALGTISGGRWLLLGIILLSSLLNAVYFFRVIEKLYLEGASAEDRVATLEEGGETVSGTAVSLLGPPALIAIGLVAVGLGNVPIVQMIQTMLPEMI